MKKFITLLSGLYFFIASSVSSMELLASGLASGTLEGLMPLLQPIAEETVMDTIKHLKGVITGASCPLSCRGPTGVPCLGPHILSSCKQTCQKIENLGGYELRIRFGTNWSLAKCVKKGVDAGHQTPQGKGNPKSIALYSQKDLDDLLELIKIQMAARKVINTKGAVLKANDLKKLGKTVDQVIKESEELVTHIDASIKKNVEDGVYGNQ